MMIDLVIGLVCFAGLYYFIKGNPSCLGEKVFRWFGIVLFTILMVGNFINVGIYIGQTHAINGYIYYELKQQTNGESKWERIK